MAALNIRNLCKTYRGRKIVDGVSLNINSGEVVGLLGPNGAGKTVCFYMIMGLTACDEGNILLGQEDITHYPMYKRARMGLGYLPQEASVFRKLSVAENIMAILETRPELSISGRQSIMEELLMELHIHHLRQSPAISLSGGERRRVEIARALAARPRFMLLDEPFAGVDPVSVSEIQHLIAHLRDKNIGILITDHNVRETLGVCDRSYIISNGQVIVAGDPDHILENQHVRRIYLGENFRL